MAEGKKATPTGADEMLGAIIADGGELWQLADEFVASLPVHMKLMQEALRKTSLEFMRQTHINLLAAKKTSRGRIIQAAQMADAAEASVVGGLAARMDDLTAVILQLQQPPA